MFFLMIDPIAFTLGPFAVRWYGILMATAFFLGLWLAMREARRLGVNAEVFVDLLFWILPAAIIGARVYYVMFNWQGYSDTPFEIFAIWKGGLAIHGGLLGAFAAGYVYVRKHRLPFLLIADIAAPSIILGQAIGRWGNFINQEAYGGSVTASFLHSLRLPQWFIEQMNIFGTYYHPTFLYESVWNIVGFSILLVLRYLHLRRGTLFFSYLIWYSIGRFFIEGLRTDSLTFQGPSWLETILTFLWSPMKVLFEPGEMAGGTIRVAQLMSVCMIVASLCFIEWYRRKGETERYGDEEGGAL